MCGICGGWSRERGGVSKGLLKKMCDAIVYRGPDDVGYYVDDHFAFGMRRLSIIDLGGGHQPIHNEDKSIWVVFNGEIYNFKEIRSDLEKKGHRFYTNTDTEVIVHAYEEYGYECLCKFNGMFAFALYDLNKKLYFIARDRIGIKPLYYYFKDRKFLFGSEIKSILEDDSVERVINRKGLYYYMGYEYVPAPDSIFQDIFKLPAGHYLVFDGESAGVEKYWDVTDFSSLGCGVKHYSKKLLDMLEDSVRQRLVSDVPVGVFLSGGIDSSTIVALMSEMHDEPVKTFSIGFEDETYNELDYARKVSDYFNTDHHEIIYTADSVKVIEEMVKYFDEPLSNISSPPTFLLSKLAGKHVKVALGGDGADELFGGYDRYIASRVDRYYRLLPLYFRNKFRYLVGDVPPQSRRQGFVNSLRQFVDGSSLDLRARHARWQMVPRVSEDGAVFSSDFLGAIGEFNAFEPITKYYDACCSSSELVKSQYVDVKSYLVDNILAKTDRVSMANSLEVRVPFLDHNVVEFSAKIPPNMRMANFTKKYVLRRAVADLLPAEIVRRRKQGLLVPVKKWMSDDLRSYVVDILGNAEVFREGMINRSYVKKILEQHLSGRYDHGTRLWTFMNLELWYRKYMLS